jgi:hypothetical protein
MQPKTIKDFYNLSREYALPGYSYVTHQYNEERKSWYILMTESFNRNKQYFRCDIEGAFIEDWELKGDFCNAYRELKQYLDKNYKKIQIIVAPEA